MKPSNVVMALLSFSAVVFFSSRRRHTRYWRDWSSDVCSSDLDGDGAGLPVVSGAVDDPSARAGLHPPALHPHPLRSEERRVGKESRSRWSTYHSKKKKIEKERTIVSQTAQ